MAKIVLIGALPESLLNFRGALICSLIVAGHHVTTMATPASQEQVAAIKALGANFYPFPIQRNGLNPFKDLQTFFALRKAFCKLQPDVILAYTIKPVIWGGLALFGNTVPKFYALITGLGFAFQEGELVRKSLTTLVTFLYRLSLSRSTRVIFQNPDDRDLFVTRKIVATEKCTIVNGSGVDLQRFAATPLPDDRVIFLTIGRLLREKGFREYAQAARLVKMRYPSAVFRLLGPVDPSPDCIPIKEVQEWENSGWVEYLGSTIDVRPFIADSHIFVLPSYHEGMPRTVLEAMAMGRPILTTDVSGCRETVVSGENGYLIPKADTTALAESMIWFIEHPNQWHRMGQASRFIAEDRFDVHKVNEDMLRLMNLKSNGSFL